MKVFCGHRDRVTCVGFTGKDDEYLISGSYDKTVKIWDIGSLSLLKNFGENIIKGNVFSLNIQENSNKIAISGSCPFIYIWDY